MKNNKIDRLICILIVAALLLAISGGLIYWFYVKQPKPMESTISPIASATPQPGLTKSEDFACDRSKLFASYDADLTYTKGEQIKLSDFHGKPVVLFFWSSWCGDCKQYLTGAWHEAVKAAEDRGAVVLMVCREGRRGETAKSAYDCLNQYHIERDTLMDEQASLFEQLGLKSVPSMAFISPEGILMLTTNELLDALGMSERVSYTMGEAAEKTEAFITQNLLHEYGSIASSYSFDKQGKLVAKDIQLVETQGLMMEYAIKKGDKALFDQVFSFVKSEMTYDGLCAWQRKEGEVFLVNATLDDLRIIHALLQAQVLWHGYEDEIALREEALWNGVVQDDMLLDFVEFDKDVCGQETTLCYLDITALDALVQYQSRWQQVRDRAYTLLENGLISTAFPLYYPRYDVRRGVYTGTKLQMNEAMLSVLHAVQTGAVNQHTLDYLENMLNDGPVYASYLMNGEPEPGYLYESTATYALLVQIGIASGRENMTSKALERMETYRSFAEPLLGGYGMITDAVHHTFDDMQALLAWSCI